MSTQVDVDELLLPSPADFHTHLRQGTMMKLVAPHVAQGGMRLAYVMPNLTPPITDTALAIEYHAQLEPLMPGIQILMTLFLSPSLTPEEIKRAKASGIVAGVKSYPRGVTTGSEAGVESYERYYDVFAEMERQDLVLNLHGEVPSNADADISVLNAESRFLEHLVSLHTRFPRLRIVLEHATTSAAVDCVKSLGETVACTITAHHLALSIDDVVGQPLHFCKPVAKTYSDRRALRQVVASGHPRFFLGSDSAPHPSGKKMPAAGSTSACAAGVYTSPHLLPLLATLFEHPALEPSIPLDRLAGFAGQHGRRWYRIPGSDTVRLRRVQGDGQIVAASWPYDGERVVPFMAGQRLSWTIAES